MIKSRKLISIFVSAAMLVTMLSAFTTVASAEETAQAYTVHLWETFESGAKNATCNQTAALSSMQGVYGNAAKLSYKGPYVSNNNYAQLDFALTDTITVAEALENNLKVEVEFDFCASALATDDNYFYLTSSSKNSSNYAAGFSIKKTGQTKALKYNGSGNVDVKSKYDTLSTFHTFKIVVHAEKAGYTNPVTNTATTADGWVLDGFYFDGTEQKGQAKYTLGGLTGTHDFTNLFFRFKSNTDFAGEIGLDNVSVISYSADSSPAPDKRAFIENVINNYSEKAGTPAYVKAFDLFEKDYITTDEINEVYYMLEGSSDLYTIDDIYNSARGVKVTSNDTVGGTPILIVGAFLNDKLYDAFSVELNIANGSSETISFPAEFVVEDKASLRAFIFASVDCLVPLAKARKE